MRRQPGRRSRRGLTLIEVLVVISIVAVAMTGVSMGLNSLTRANLRSACMQLAGAARYAYHRALTQGTTVRMSMKFEDASLVLTEAEGRVVLVRSDDPTREALQEDDDLEDPGAAIDPWAAAAARLNDPDVLSLGASPFGALTGRSGKALKRFSGKSLGTGVRFAKVIVAHEQQPVEDGIADLYFFPGGQTQHAVVQLVDRSETIYSVEIHPLTGRVKMHTVPHEPEVLMDDLEVDDDEASEVEEP